MRVVFDSNVLVAAFTGRGLCADLWDACLRTHTVVTGPQIFDEVRRALEVKMKMPKDTVSKFIDHIRKESERVDPVAISDVKCRDPHDVGIIGIAVAGNVEAIVTGDSDLQVLGEYQSISIITPRQFWERIARK